MSAQVGLSSRAACARPRVVETPSRRLLHVGSSPYTISRPPLQGTSTSCCCSSSFNNGHESSIAAGTQARRWTRKPRQHKRSEPAVNPDDEIMELNVGGRSMVTTRSTLLQFPGSVLHDLFSPRNHRLLIRDAQGRVFLDYDPHTFAQVLKYLREVKMAGGRRGEAMLGGVGREDQGHLTQLMQHLRIGMPAARANRAAASQLPQHRPGPPATSSYPAATTTTSSGATPSSSSSLSPSLPESSTPLGTGPSVLPEGTGGTNGTAGAYNNAVCAPGSFPTGAASSPQAGPSQTQSHAAPPAPSGPHQAGSGSSSRPGGLPLQGPAMLPAKLASIFRSASPFTARRSSSSSSPPAFSQPPSQPPPTTSSSSTAGSSTSSWGAKPSDANPKLAVPPVPRPPSSSQLYYINAQYEAKRGIKISVFTEADISSMSGEQPFDVFCDATEAGGELSFTFVCRQDFDDVFLGITTRNQLDRRGSQIPCFGWRRRGALYAGGPRAPPQDRGSSGPSSGSGSGSGSGPSFGAAAAAAAGAAAAAAAAAQQQQAAATAGQAAAGAAPMLWCRGDSVELIVSMGDATRPSRMVLKVNGREVDHMAGLPSLRNWCWYVALYTGGEMSCVTFMSDSYAVFWGDYQVKRYLA